MPVLFFLFKLKRARLDRDDTHDILQAILRRLDDLENSIKKMDANSTSHPISEPSRSARGSRDANTNQNSDCQIGLTVRNFFLLKLTVLFSLSNRLSPQTISAVNCSFWPHNLKLT
jgi:hypothetical protein